MSYKLSGINPLAYMGVEPTTPPQAVVLDRDPTINDNNFNLLTLWLNTTNEVTWELVNLNGGNARWVRVGSGTGSLLTLTTQDSVVVSPTAGNINVIGGTGITTTGSGSTVTISTTTSVPLTFESGNDSTTATAAADVITFLGTGDTTITASGSTV